MIQHLYIFGEVLFDTFPDGHQVLGGAPFNVARHLQAFGQRPVFISCIGNDQQGDSIRRSMIDWDMDIRALQIDESLPTGKVTIQLEDREPVYDIVSPSAYDAINIASPVIKKCCLLYHGSLALRHSQSARSLDQLIKTNPECVFLDVNLRPPWWDKDTVLSLIKQAHWTKLNINEFNLLYPGNDLIFNRLSSFIDKYKLMGVILTYGEEGAEVLNLNGEHFKVKPNNDIKVVDTVGAGDAFASVMIMGIINDWPMQTTLERAQVFASSIVGRRGATVADPVFYKNIRTSWNS